MRGEDLVLICGRIDEWFVEGMGFDPNSILGIESIAYIRS